MSKCSQRHVVGIDNRTTKTQQATASGIMGINCIQIINFFFFLRDFIFKKTLFEKLQYLKQEQLITCNMSNVSKFLEIKVVKSGTALL